jgi:hypothetical protein
VSIIIKYTFLEVNMVHSCSVWNCTQRRTRDSGVGFFKFPDDKLLKAAWIRGTRRKDYRPNKYSRVCSRHFKETDFRKIPGVEKLFLKKDAVPSIIEGLPPHLQPKEKVPRKGPKRRTEVCKSM